MKKQANLQIDILGTSFTINADEDPDYLQALLNYYKKTVGNIEKSVGLDDSLKIAILAGVMLTDELYKERRKNNPDVNREEQEAVESITNNIIQKIDTIL